MTIPAANRYVAVRGKDWDGKRVYRIYDAANPDRGHIASMVWSRFRLEYQCSFHRAEYWDTQVSDWRDAIAQVEGWR